MNTTFVPTLSPAACQQNRYHGLFIASLGLLLLVYWPSWQSMFAIWWRSDTFAHGMLIAPISAYLVWLRWPQLQQIAPVSVPWVTAGLVGCGFTWWIATLAGVQTLQQFAIVAMIPVLVLAIYGWAITRLLLFPLAYLFFMVPFGEFLTQALQDFTAVFTVQALRLSGLAVFWEGHQIVTANGHFEVAEACSGLRYLIASMALGTIYAYLVYRSLSRRLLFVLAAFVVPIIANGLRAYGIVMIAHFSDMRYAVGVDHLIYGWLFFGLIVFLMFWIGSFWAQKPTLPMPMVSIASPKTSGNRFITTAFLVVILLPTGLALWGLMQPATVTTERLQAQWQAPWPQKTVGPGVWSPTFHQADQTQLNHYSMPLPVSSYVAIYGPGNAQHMVSSINQWHNSPWIFAARQLQTVTHGQTTWQVSEVRVNIASNSRLIWHWYQVGSHHTVSMVWAKFYELIDQIIGNTQPSCALAISTPIVANEDQARQRLQEFLDQAHLDCKVTN